MPDAADPQPLRIRAAQEFVDLVKHGATLEEAALATGTTARARLVAERLKGLSAYHFAEQEEREAIADAVLMEVLLDESTEARDRIAAAGKLKKSQDGPLVEVNLSPDVLALKPTVFSGDKE